MLKSFWVIKKKKSWEMWRKALSNYSVYLGSWWWNIYITAMEVLKVIKLAGCVSSLFPRFSGLFREKKRPKRGGSHFSSPRNCLAVEPQRATSASVVSSSLNATFNRLNQSGGESLRPTALHLHAGFSVRYFGFVQKCQINARRRRHVVKRLSPS